MQYDPAKKEMFRIMWHENQWRPRPEKPLRPIDLAKWREEFYAKYPEVLEFDKEVPEKKARITGRVGKPCNCGK